MALLHIGSLVSVTAPYRSGHPKTFHQKTLWPTYLAFTAELESHLRELTDRAIRAAVNDDVREAEEEPKALPEH